jgi:hypothetical protein
MEIWLVLFRFEEMLLVTFDGRSKSYGTSDEQDLAHMQSVLGTPVTEAQRINYTEAALIRYFRPPYNTEYKNSFPSPAHASYAECYDLDLNAVTVEIDSRQIRCRLWSEAVEPTWIHLPRFELHSKEERQSMFDFFPEASG